MTADWNKLKKFKLLGVATVAPSLLAALSILLTPAAEANIIGTETQNFNITPNAHDYVTVHSSKTLGKGGLHLGLFLNNAVNSLPYFDENNSDYETSSRGRYSDSILGSELSIGYGILDNLDIGINLPGVVYQDVSNDEETHGEYAGRGITEIRINTKLRLLGTNLFGLATILSTNIDSIEDNPYAGKNSGPSLNAELAGDVFLGPIELAANIGYRWKNSGEKHDEDAPIEPYKNQLLSSAAASYMISTYSTKLIAEVFSSSPSDKTYDKSKRHTTRAESLLGMKVYYNDNFIYHFGGGSELRHSVASADWRAYAGLNYVMTSKAKKMAVRPAPAIPKRKPVETVIISDVLFKFDSDELANRKQKADFSNVGKAMNRQKNYKMIVIEGHTCSQGAAVYNKSLSKKRAAKIKQMLVNQYNIDPRKVIPVGFGEEKPMASNKTELGRVKNRRVEFKIYN